MTIPRSSRTGSAVRRSPSQLEERTDEISQNLCAFSCSSFARSLQLTPDVFLALVELGWLRRCHGQVHWRLVQATR